MFLNINKHIYVYEHLTWHAWQRGAIGSVCIENLCARSRYQVQGQVITSHSVCGDVIT